MKARICDGCGKQGDDALVAGWAHVETGFNYVLAVEPAELDFCGWECLAEYAFGRRTAGEQMAS